MGDNHFFEAIIPPSTIQPNTIAAKTNTIYHFVDRGENSGGGGGTGFCEVLRQIGQNGKSRLLTVCFSRIHCFQQVGCT